MRAEEFGGTAYVPSFLHPEKRPLLYRGLGPKAAKARSRGAPAAGVMRAVEFGGTAYVPSFLHPEKRPLLYRGLGPKVAKARSRGA
jgi:hypothetical protein